ncbi:CBN-CDC-6 protein [Caenorhabditis brenneri]|uniref:Cell division control protein n=1 Tax=Caenorhabditis brenneri TaxID=135651 RepID=G0NJT7_CAEBE|nr:CBN-CDC-6 protein [Caenorhabditis brenneri]
MSTSLKTTRRSQKSGSSIAKISESGDFEIISKRSRKPVFEENDSDVSNEDNTQLSSSTSRDKRKLLLSPGSELAGKVETLQISKSTARKRQSKATNLKNKTAQPRTPEKKTRSRSGSGGTPEKKLRNSENSEPEMSSETSNRQENETEALKAREEEFESIKSWITKSKEMKQSLSIYISGQPGTGKTATTMRVLKALGNSVRSCIVNCASTNTKAALFKTIFDSLDLDGKANIETFEVHVKSFKRPLVLVLDEIDHLASRKNTALYAAFQWPETLSSKIIILGIANSIDLTERLLPKLMLTKPPKRLVFEPYTKDDIVEILNDKMKKEEAAVDTKAIELTARKVAAMSGDLRTALHIFKQQKSLLNSSDSDSAQPATPVNGCREVLGIINNVYSSPLARARLPLQPRILLAVSLALSTNKKCTFDRNSLLGAYYKACESLRMPALDDDDLHSAFQTLESQSFIRQLNGGKLVLQVDAPTAKSAISDNAMLDQIGLLRL